jgi:8-oxo-dGTP diphosphatase
VTHTIIPDFNYHNYPSPVTEVWGSDIGSFVVAGTSKWLRNKEKIGTPRRPQVMVKNGYTNVSVLILYNSTGQILLQHRSHDASRLPNFWAFFGGGIEQGESPREALEREMIEELSYQVQSPYLLLAQKIRDGEDENTKYVFVEQYRDQPLQLGEGQAMGWFTRDETHELKMVEHDRAVVKQMRNYLNQLSEQARYAGPER